MYGAAVPGTAVPALWQRIACVRDFSLFTHTVVYVSTAVITFEVGRGVEVYDATAFGTAVFALSLLSACTRCSVRIRPSPD